MESSVNSQTYTDYISRINAVFDYIEANIERDMSLAELASVAHFSKFHFSRLFGRLFSWAWAGPRGLTEQRDAAPLVIYHDDPCVTEEEKLRMSVGLPVPPEKGKLTVEICVPVKPL